MNPFYKNLALWLVISLVMILLFNLFNQSKVQHRELSYTEFMAQVEKGLVNQVTIQGQEITGTDVNGLSFKTFAPEDSDMIKTLRSHDVSIKAKPPSESPWYMTVLVSWFPMILLIAVWIFFMRQMQGGGGKALSFGKSRAMLFSDYSTKVTFADVAGIDEAKEELTEIIDFLKEQGIRHGIVEEKLIHGFLEYSREEDRNFIVAAGRKPIKGKNARITYHFNTDYQRPGVIADDGSIDFRERGDVPFVGQDVLLAEKTPMEPGHPGLDIFGETIPCEEVSDCILSGGPGTRFSDDGLKLYSTIEGQPTLDPKGIVAVHKEFSIKGDVSFKTGHIDYKGNVTVSGTVKEGFRVTCVDLTANSVNGGIIETSGDLNVSEGIVNATVKTQGNLRAKYIQDSVIEVFGDLTVTREIMESDIACGGQVINENGKIIAATVAAKKGLILGQVGTEKTGKSVLKAGVDEHIKRLADGYARKIKTKEDEIREYEKGKKKIEGKIFELHKQAADLSFAHESKQREVEQLKEQFASLKGKKERMIELKKRIKAAEQVMEQYDADIKSIFKSQDILMKDVEEQEKRIEKASNEAEDLKTEKEALEEIAQQDKPEPFIKINHKATAGTQIFGTKTSLIVRYDLRPCKIIEIESTDPDDPEDRKLVTQNL